MTRKRGTSQRKNELREDLFYNVFQEAGDGIFVVDPQGVIVEVNPRGCEILGFSRDELIGQPVMKFHPADEIAHIQEKLAQLAVKKLLIIESAFIRKDGSRLPVEITGKLSSDHQIVGLLRDISTRKRAEQSLMESEQKFRSLVEKSPEGIVIINEQGYIVEWNHGQEEISGLKGAEVLGRPIWEVQFQLMPRVIRSEAILTNMEKNARGILASGHGPGLNQARETLFQLPDGSTRNVEVMLYSYKTNLGYRVGSITRDITKRKQIEILLEYLAMHDPLTDLPNRQLFQDRLELAMERARREKRGLLAIMLLDLDNFKQVNDTYGHACGDQLLKTVAQRLQGCLRKSDTAARMGGDEFALINEEVSNLESCELIAQKVLNTLSKPIEIEGKVFEIGGSIGISVYSDSQDGSALLRQADIAMYRAKEQRNCYRFYNENLHPV